LPASRSLWWATARRRRDFIYATDVAQAFLAAARTPISGERFNVGPAIRNRSTGWWSCSAGDVVYVPNRPGEPDCTFADISKIVNRFDGSRLVSFEEGVRRMLVTFERWRDAPLWDPDRIAEATKTWFRYLGKQSA
jgi:UDP-glucose 4-epimerase